MTDYERTPMSGWAVGGVYFAGVLMIVIGMFEAIAGLAAIIENEFSSSRRTTRSKSTSPPGDGSTSSWECRRPRRLLPLHRKNMGEGRRDHARDPRGGGELLLHPLLPVLVAPHHRPCRVGDLVFDASAGGLTHVELNAPSHDRHAAD
jgi:hypothetical protein